MTAPSAGALEFLPAVTGRVHWVHSASLSLSRFVADLSTALQLPRSNARLGIHSAVCDRYLHPKSVLFTQNKNDGLE